MSENHLSRWYKSGEPLLEEIEATRTETGRAALWFMGQHGFVVKIGGKTIYIDVILNDLQDEKGASMRRYPPPFGPDAPRSPDYYFATHNHCDHLNLDTILPLAKKNSQTRFIVPRAHSRILEDAGIEKERIYGTNEGEELELPGGISVHPLAAAHSDYEQNREGSYLSLGYLIRGGGLSLFHSGDTWATPRLVSSLKALSPIDIALLPINGTDWERTAAGIVGNMGALDAVKLARAVEADLVIPSHYDMMPGNSENPARFTEFLYELCPQKRFHICALGERFIYEK
jgi:L-ascorbate metabolism protein UlaG (beta-lactamase superfamily)